MFVKFKTNGNDLNMRAVYLPFSGFVKKIIDYLLNT